MTAPVFKAPSSEGAAEYVHNDSAPTVNACGRHVGRGQYDSQSPDGPLILPRQVAGRSVGGTSRLSGRTAPWKVWFGASFGRTRPTRHLQFYRSVQARPGRDLKSLRLFFLGFCFFCRILKCVRLLHCSMGIKVTKIWIEHGQRTCGWFSVLNI